jgi:hypothetical protein
MELSYTITLQIEGSQKTIHCIYAENIDDAKNSAVKIAERMGGSFLDIVSVNISSYVDDKKGRY